jgi:N-methylhydantoinase B
MSPIDLAIFISRVEAVCAEMGAILRRAALSPNIKDRLDFSCALFDRDGELFAQAAHIPVHLGSMAYAMASIVRDVDWQDGDVLVVNDPFLGGTHLPDVTLIAPFFTDGELIAFVANRAHHANIGASSPGSMPLSSRIEEEGLIIPPTLYIRGGEVVSDVFAALSDADAETGGDVAAQISANQAGLSRLNDVVRQLGREAFFEAVKAANDYGERLGRAALEVIPKGSFSFEDYMDSDGFGAERIPIRVTLNVGDEIEVDFTGTSPQVNGNINCPLSVAAAAVFYVFRCLMPESTPNCAGTYRPIRIQAPEGCLLNAVRPAATAAGNVETSMRIVDVVLGALSQALPGQVPAASQGTMNNLAMGNHNQTPAWDYYETMGGGIGASSQGAGIAASQSHMTNTLNTPIESIERHYPLRVTRYAVRSGSGGDGQHQGGDGVVREFEFLSEAEVTLLTERRGTNQPWGLNGGSPGASGSQRLDGEKLPAKANFKAQPGQKLRLESPGGGGFGID